ncbi:hypothetical protein Tco_0337083 [Tanacetum coccineum]
MNTHKDGFDIVHGKTGAVVVISLAAVDEWQPPRCDISKIFNHIDDQCPKNVKVAAPTQESDDGFVEVTRKHGKGKQNGNKEASSQLKSNVNDTGNPMDDLVDETRKKVEVLLKKTPEKTGI